MKKILITGGAGLLGSNLVLTTVKDYKVYYTCRELTRIPGANPILIDLTDEKRVKEMIEIIKPDCVFHCAAMTDVDKCETNCIDAFINNVTVTQYIAETCKENKSKLIYISTDFVFNGIDSNYQEWMLKYPVNYYGETKLMGEEAVKEFCNDYAIIRTSIYGWNLKPKKSLAEWIVSELLKQNEIIGFTDSIFSPLNVNNLSRVLLEIFEKDLQGIIHVSSPDSCSKYKFATMLAEEWGLNKDLIKPGKVNNNSKAKRPCNVSLEPGGILDTLDTKLLTVKEGIKEYRRLYKNGWGSELKGFNNKDKPVIIIPAYNEEKTIEKVLTEVKKYSKNIIVQDDGSTDKTSEIAKKYNVLVEKEPMNIKWGYDCTVSVAFWHACNHGFNIFITFDADGQHCAKDIPRILEPILKNKTDIVVGKRPYKTRFAEKLFSWYSKKKIGVSDPLCGLKAYRLETVRMKDDYTDNCKYGFPFPIGCKYITESIGTTYLFNAHKLGFRIKEVPISLNKRQDKSRIGNRIVANFKILWALWRTIWSR